MNDLKARLTKAGLARRRFNACAEYIDQRLIGRIVSHMHRRDIFGDAQGKTECAFTYTIPTVDWHNDAQRAHFPHLQSLGRVNFVRHALVMPMNAAEGCDERRYDKNRDPCSLGE